MANTLVLPGVVVARKQPRSCREGGGYLKPLIARQMSFLAKCSLYEQYVEKMTKAQEEEGLLVPTLTPDQQAKQAALAEEIISEIRRERDPEQ